MDSLFDGGNAEDVVARAAMGHMFECYEALRGGVDCIHALALHSRLLALQSIALEEHFLETWAAKPKLHHLLERCADGGLPSGNWNDRDEDFGGACSGMARRRGGCLGPASSTSNLLNRFNIRAKSPRLRRVHL